MYRSISLEGSPRQNTFEFFKDFQDPFFNLTADVDVTGLHAWLKQRGLSFFLGSLHCLTHAANSVPEFRRRIRDQHIIEHDRIHPGSTILLEDESFAFCYFQFADDIAQFITDGAERIQALKRNPHFLPATERDDLIHLSVIPWVSFSSFKHARRFGMHDYVPKLVMGKYRQTEGRLRMPVSVEVHHCLADGLHVGRFFQAFQQQLDRYH